MNIKNTEKLTKKNRMKMKNDHVGFFSMYRIFRTKILIHFLFALITVMIYSALVSTNNKIFQENKTLQSISHDCSRGSCSHGKSAVFQEDIQDDHSEENHHHPLVEEKDYSKYLFFQNTWKKIFSSRKIERREFIIVLLFLLSAYTSFNYFTSSFEKDISAESYFHLKNILLKKLWNLKLEQKKEKIHELRAIFDTEIETVSDLWEHLPNHLFQSALTILVLGTDRFVGLKNAEIDFSIPFFFLFATLFLAVYAKTSDISTKKYEKYREIATEELTISEKQISNSQLIENMGLTSFHQKLEREGAKKSLFFEKSLGRSMIFLGNIISFMPECYRYLSLFLTSLPLGTALISISPLFLIFDSMKSILDCFKEYGKYKIALSKINDFLSLDEREENWEAESVVNLTIEEIAFVDVDFKYLTSEKMIIENYSNKFSGNIINEITGSNGAGKTTILYLILGVIKPLKGKVLVKFLGREVMNLHEEINLREWREKIVSYVSHDNLVEEGSTGQKQLENISMVLEERKDSQIFIFDESANALDSEKQRWLTDTIEKLLKEDKIVFSVYHKANVKD